MQRLKLSESVITAFIELFEMSRDMQFAIGDKLIELVRTHGDKAEVIRQLSGELGVTPSVLYDYYRVSENWKGYQNGNLHLTIKRMDLVEAMAKILRENALSSGATK